jgi:DNA-binding HxlR family transcriptional regulator
MKSYGQFCPVAMAAETLTERWTPLVLRELLCGSTRFNDLRRGLPLMSPSLLVSRLRMLERVGIVERREGQQQTVHYRLTRAGEELRPVIEALGVWGQRWARGDVRPEHLDASLLMWDVHRCVEHSRLPRQRVVVHFRLNGSSDGKSRFWLVLAPGEADLCLRDPGYDVDLWVEGDVRAMVRYWMGDAGFDDLIRAGELTVSGPGPFVRAFPSWFRRSSFAEVERPAGVEMDATR